MKIGPRGRVTLLIVGAFVVAAILALLRMSHLPLRLPADFTVQWRSGGGQLPTRSEAIISLEESRWTFTEGSSQDATEFVFVTTPQEMEDLYRLLRRHAVDQLKEETGELYDGDNAGLSLLWQGHYVNIWGLRVIPNQQSRYDAAYDGLLEFLEGKIPEHPPLN